MLEWFGVETIYIDCNSIEVKVIMRLKLIKEGAKYIFNKMENCLKNKKLLAEKNKK